MAQEIINVGAAPNDGTGDPIRTSFTKCNNNFNQLYSRVQESPPVTLTGSVGDAAGMIAYDEEFLYYCFADFDGSTIIWNQVPNAGNAQITMLTATGNITGAYFFGDGSGLTNVPAGDPTGVQNGNSNIAIASNGNITFSATGRPGILTVTNLVSNSSPSYGAIIEGQLAVSSNVQCARLTSSGNITGDVIISTLGFITPGDISLSNLVISGNISNANVDGSLRVTGNASFGSSIVGNANVTGNVTGGNITTGGLITAVGNITSSGGYFIGDGGFLSNVTAASNVAVSQIANGTSVMSVDGSGGNINMTVDGTANLALFHPTGMDLTGNIDATGNIEAGNLISNGIIVAGGNITGGNLRTGGSILAVTTVTGGTLVSTGNANVTGNVHGSNVIATGNIVGGNLVTAGNLVASGNITGGNLILSGTFNVGNLTATNTVTGNSLVSNNGVTATGNVTGANVVATSNVVGGNLTTGGQVVASGNITGGNILSGGLINITGSFTSSGLITINGGANPNAIVNGAANAVGNIGASTKYFNSIFADSFVSTSVTAAGNVTGGNIVSTNGITATGNVTGNNVVAVNTVLGVSVTATGNVTGNNIVSNNGITATGNVIGANFITTGLLSATGNLSGGNLIATSTVSTASITKTGSNSVGNIGSSANYFNTVFADTFNGTSTQALYADLAERYTTDRHYEPGTVLCFGGNSELTLSTVDGDPTVAGVVSTQPAYEMNSGLEGEFVTKLALVGRVPCRVIGPVWPGAMMVSAGNGLARAERTPAMGTVIGKALEAFDGDQGTIEIVVGRL